MQHRTHELVERIQVEARLDRPGLEPHQIEQRGDALAHVRRLLAHRARQRPPIGIAQRIEIAGERGGAAGDGGQRRAQVMRDRRQQRVADRFGLGAYLGRLRVGGEIGALQCQSDLGRECLEQPVLLRQGDAPRILRQHREHAERALAAGERQIQSGRAGQRIGTHAGGLAMIEHPLRDPEVGAGVGQRRAGVPADRPRGPVRRRTAAPRGWRTPGSHGAPPPRPSRRGRAPSRAAGSSRRAAPCAARDSRRRAPAGARWR